MSGRPLDVRIDELVLDGFAPDDRRGIEESVEEAFVRDLAALVTTLAPRSELCPGSALDGGTLQVAPGAGPGELGSVLARRVASAITHRTGGGEGR